MGERNAYGRRWYRAYYHRTTPHARTTLYNRNRNRPTKTIYTHPRDPIYCPRIPPITGRPYYLRARGGNRWQIPGWLDLCNEIPEYKRALLKNATVLKYHVKLHSDFWRLTTQKPRNHRQTKTRSTKPSLPISTNSFQQQELRTPLFFCLKQRRDGNSQQPSISIEPIKNERGTGGKC